MFQLSLVGFAKTGGGFLRAFVGGLGEDNFSLELLFCSSTESEALGGEVVDKGCIGTGGVR